MNASELNEQLEAMQQFAEVMGGTRRALIAQGFSAETAELLIVHALIQPSAPNPPTAT